MEQEQHNPDVKTCDTPPCEKCSGRTALMAGYWSYWPDDEPYNNSEREESIAQGADGAYVCGYKCDDCGHLQDLWHEG